MSALLSEADIQGEVVECLLLTQSGHIASVSHASTSTAANRLRARVRALSMAPIRNSLSMAGRDRHRIGYLVAI